MPSFNADFVPPADMEAWGSQIDRVWRNSGRPFQGTRCLPIKGQEGPLYPFLSAALKGTATALEGLAPAVEYLAAGLPGVYGVAAPCLLLNLQRAQGEIEYLSEFIQRQRRTIEEQTQEIMILSQELSKSQAVIAEQANDKPGISSSL